MILVTWQHAKHNLFPSATFFSIEICRTERAKRFRYSALKKKWVQDIVLVKMQEEVGYVLSVLRSGHFDLF